MRLRVTHWITATVRWRRVPATVATRDAAPPTGPPLDHERVLQVGDLLHVCYPEKDETLDDGLTALMLRLTVEPADPSAPRKR
ncbi:MAG: hypothetical protein JWM65_3304 [Sphingomonas bacterium]|nr:hypothetical protein [Sphingomonas bacterium]